MTYESIALLMFLSLVVLMMTGQRVFAAIGFVAAIMALVGYGVGGEELAFNQAFKLFRWTALVALPLFVFMGYVMARSGIAEDLYRMFHVWLGRIPGGLAIGTILLMVVISAMNGLSVAGMAIGATVALPEMLRRGYDKVLVTGVVQGGSSLGILLPPSVVMILYGAIAGQPVDRLWLAGIVPGLLMAILFIAYVTVRARLNPALAPPASDADLDMPLVAKLALIRAGILPVLIFVSMIGLFLAGYTFLHESAAIGAAATLLAAAVKRRLTWTMVRKSAEETLAISCLFMWIILAALAFSTVFDGLGAVRAVESLFITRWELTPWQVIILMQLSFILLGMFFDDTAMLVIVAPLYIPLVRMLDLGFDSVREQMIWFGVLYTMTCQIAYITPPFGYNLFLMRGMAPPEVSLWDIYRSIWPFVAMMALTIGLVMAFPEIALILI
ncbi:TRAP transporter large permease subunit [Salinarimonas sp.]|uniref:TRAP transporter large permease n=1 Tax=Salinarimonas sp. TaxID=2766526 RepID=UPI00391B98ED